MKKNRKVILHYHLFKNAGTSLDAALKEAFGKENWITKEFPNNPKLNKDSVKQWIVDNPEVVCFSSHTAFLPPPKIEGVDIFPIIFLRNPIDRIISAYNFERKQNAATFGSTLARNTTLEGYIETRLSIPNDRQCRNFHTHRLAMMYPENEGEELTRAKKAIRELPFVGLVEEFDKSISDLNQKLNDFGFLKTNISVLRKNSSNGNKLNLIGLKNVFFINNDDFNLIKTYKNDLL